VNHKAFAILFLFALFGACNKETQADTGSTTLNCEDGACVVEASFSKIVVTGLVELGDGGEVYVVKNADSRSRISYEITGGLVAEIAALAGQNITVSGLLIESGTWSGTIEAASYQDADSSLDTKLPRE